MPKQNSIMTFPTCIAVTCSSLKWATAVEAELTILQKQGIIPEAVKLLAVEDPANNIGSGAATLNALIVVTEFLSVREGYSVISSDVLLSSTTVILHTGRDYAYEPCGKAFGHLLPVCYEGSSSDAKVQTNLERLFNLIQKLQQGGPPGVWVCSTDMMLSIRGIGKIDWDNVKDGLLFCCPSTPEYATSHGAVEIDSDGNLANILYSAPLETLRSHFSCAEKVQIVSGIVFLSARIAESLLSLHAKSPLDSCTYLGLDSGGEPIQMSLFFDLLMAMATSVSKETFMSGHCGRLYDRRFSLSRNMSFIRARGLIWDELSQYSLKIGSLKNVAHHYLSHSITGEIYLNHLWSCNTQKGYRHTECEVENKSDPNFLVMNSLLKSENRNIGNQSVLRDCCLSAPSITVGQKSFLNGVIYHSQNKDFRIPDATCAMQFEVSLPSIEHTISVLVVLGTHDNLNISRDDPEFKIFNCSLKEFYDMTSWTAHDLWGPLEGDTTDNLLTAKLFPVDGDIVAIISILEGAPDHTCIKRWKDTQRLSLKEVLHGHLIKEQLARRWETYFSVAASVITTTLTEATDVGILPYFVIACATGHEKTLMSVLDNVAEGKHAGSNLGVACRTISCIADFLGVMAGKAGGLRSGPGGNRAWLSAFELLEKGNIAQGAVALRAERQNWMDRPDRLMRAARHYEGALQVLIRLAVSTSIQCVIASSSGKQCLCNTWVVAECPARLDLFGGWTDTPPICYEMGGSVINIAVLVDSKRPVGAKARRLDSLHIALKLLHDDIMEEIYLDSTESLLDYNQPGARGALLKACLIGADIVQISPSALPLTKQLLDRYNGGIELQTWSSLPQGSGLGTSSILASAIVGALWTVTGRVFDRASVIHCVLNVEQLLTTGGGWQDQVGGVSGGLCRGFSKRAIPLKVYVERLPLTEEFAATLSSHFLLLYTGKVRLAKNLLQTVIRNWYARDPEVVACFKELHSKCQTSAKEAFLKQDLLSIATKMNEYWALKKVLASGCEPQFVRHIVELLEPHLLGHLLVGAGGGGFLCVLTKKPNMLDFIRGLLSSTKGMERVTVHKVDIDQVGLSISVAGEPISLAPS